MLVEPPNEPYFARPLADQDRGGQKGIWIESDGTLHVVFRAHVGRNMLTTRLSQNDQLVTGEFP